MTNCSCCRIFGIFIQILVIASLILYLITLDIEINIKSKIMLIILIIVYVLYIITEFCSPTFIFLCSKKNKDEIINSLSQLIKTNPKIIISYRVSKILVNIKRTIEGTINFSYYSSRDVSGLLELDISNISLKGIAYVALEIEQEINFADEISYMDLVSYGNILSKLFPGYYIEFFEDKRIILPNYNSYNFIRILDKDPCFVNRIFYILFTIIPIVEIYKCYINSYIYEKKFIIRKLISTRYDLNQDKYKVFNPHIKFLGQEYSFDSIDYNYININHELKSPTENEINVASQFNKKIPKYECESLININDENKIGIIKDDPNYR